MESKLFSENRYITRGVSENIDIRIQMVLWYLIDQLRTREYFQLDYLQVFHTEREIEEGHSYLKITHKQEVEPYNISITIPYDKEVNEKIFVIRSNYEDGKEYSTMMLAEEY